MTTSVSTPTQVAKRLEELAAAGRLGLFTDFDGTLSPVAPTPDDAVAAPGAVETLEALSRSLPVVGIVTGRGIDDVRRRIDLPELLYVGNHGLESLHHGEHRVHPAGQAAADVLPALFSDIRERLAAQVSLDGVIFEDKRYSGSIHFRLSPEPATVETALKEIIAELAPARGFRSSPGKMVIELRPLEEVTKGTAVRELIASLNLDCAVFLGDDVTDADAFVVLNSMRQEGTIDACSVGVLTLDTAESVIANADFLLDGVDAVIAALLEFSESFERES